jgi:hypothetical protein
MNFKKINLKKQSVSKDIIEDALQLCYNNISFSTFPYIVFGLTTSEDTIKKYSSGNCIGLSLFLKKYLKNIGIKSYLIPASVPSIHMVPGVNHICHVSLLIPYDNDKFYIIDPAFYFLKPMHCSIKHNIHREIESCNIHNNVNEKIKYILQKTNYDAILPNSFECKCYFDTSPKDPWSYFLNEVLDPDESIGSIYIKAKPNPFLCHTEYDESSNLVKKRYHIKTEGGELIVIKDCIEIYKGDSNKMPKEIKHIMQNKLYKYFSNYIV